MSSKSTELYNQPIIFFPINRYIHFCNALSSTIYSYRLNSNSKDDEPLSTIYSFLEITSEEYPESILISCSGHSADKKVHSYFLTRILAMLILLKFDFQEYMHIVINKRRNDPIKYLNKLADVKDLGLLIKLFSIFINFSDYNSDSVLMFCDCFREFFLRLIKLPKLGKDHYVYLREMIYEKSSGHKKDDIDDDIDDYEEGINIIKFTRTIEKVDSKNKIIYYFHQIQANDEQDEIPYASIHNDNKEICFSLNLDQTQMNCKKSFDSLLVNYEMTIKSNDEQNKYIEDLIETPRFEKTIEKNNGKNPEFEHFMYFSNKMNYIYKQIKGLIPQDIYELKSIIYNIYLFNYYAVTIPQMEIDITSIFEQFCSLENCLILLMESINEIKNKPIGDADPGQYSNKFLQNTVVDYFHLFFKRSKKIIDEIENLGEKDTKKDDDGDDSKNGESKTKLDDVKEEFRSILTGSTHFFLSLILLAGKIIYEDNDSEGNIIIYRIKSNKNKEWMKYFRSHELKPEELKTARDESNRLRNIVEFELRNKTGSLMDYFYKTAISFYYDKIDEVENAFNCVIDNSLELRY